MKWRKNRVGSTPSPEQMPSTQGAVEPALPGRQRRPLGGDAGGGAGGFSYGAVEPALPGRQRRPLGVTPKAARGDQLNRT